MGACTRRCRWLCSAAAAPPASAPAGPCPRGWIARNRPRQCSCRGVPSAGCAMCWRASSKIHHAATELTGVRHERRGARRLALALVVRGSSPPGRRTLSPRARDPGGHARHIRPPEVGEVQAGEVVRDQLLHRREGGGLQVHGRWRESRRRVAGQASSIGAACVWCAPAAPPPPRAPAAPAALGPRAQSWTHHRPWPELASARERSGLAGW